MGYQSCFKKHNIENDWSTDNEEDVGSGGVDETVVVGDATATRSVVTINNVATISGTVKTGEVVVTVGIVATSDMV